MKVRFATINYAIQMVSESLRRKTIIALFNSEEDAKEFVKYCIKRYADEKFEVIEFEN